MRTGIETAYSVLLLVCLLSGGAFAKTTAVPSGCWAGRYTAVGRNHVMTIERFGSDLSVEIRDLDAKTEPPPGGLIASFVAHVSGNVAKFRELRDPSNCQADLYLTSEGIRFEDRCGSPTGGLYVKTK